MAHRPWHSLSLKRFLREFGHTPSRLNRGGCTLERFVCHAGRSIFSFLLSTSGCQVFLEKASATDFEAAVADFHAASHRLSPNEGRPDRHQTQSNESRNAQIRQQQQ